MSALSASLRCCRVFLVCGLFFVIISAPVKCRRGNRTQTYSSSYSSHQSWGGTHQAFQSEEPNMEFQWGDLDDDEQEEDVEERDHSPPYRTTKMDIEDAEIIEEYTFPTVVRSTMVYQKPLKLEASPVSTGNLTLKLYEFVAIALDYHQLERGVEEVTKVVSSNRAEFVVLAADVKPFRTVEDCIRAAHKKNVPYIFMPSKKALGQALQMKSPLFAAVVVRIPRSRIQKEIEMVKKEIIELHQS